MTIGPALPSPPTTTAFRQKLCASLKAALDVEFVGGPIDSLGSENRDIGCVWLEGKVPFGGDGNVEQNTYGVRLFRVWFQQQGDNVQARNVDLLEADVEKLQYAFRQVLITAGHDFFNVVGVTPNYEGQYVEAALTAFDRNVGSAGG